jgi:AraC-like DNA-binding protein
MSIALGEPWNSRSELIAEAIEQAASIIRERYHEPLTIDRVATEVFFSPFYFSRMFQRFTGATPSQYLQAVRQFEAKRLLMTTSLTVSDVVSAVGYNSVGTFTTRFVRETGLTPTQLRDPEIVNHLAAMGPRYSRMPSCDLAMNAKPDPSGQPTGAIVGTIEVHDTVPADVLVGVFNSVVPQREPVACQILKKAGTTEVFINQVPGGRWFVIAVGAPSPARAGAAPHVVGTSAPVVVNPGCTATATVRLHRPRIIDVPFATLIARPANDVSGPVRLSGTAGRRGPR